MSDFPTQPPNRLPITLPKVLCIEDNMVWQQRWAEQLKGIACVLQAVSEQEALSLLREFPDIEVIVLDGNLDGSGELDTLDLLRTIRNRFTGVLIAASSDAKYRRKLLKHGCAIAGPKQAIPDMIALNI